MVIDEVQKVPALLDEVYWLLENRGVQFALCGSSARKPRRGGVNLLGGRALRLDKEHPQAARRVIVCLEPRPRRTDDGIDILPAKDFADRLWRGELLAAG